MQIVRFPGEPDEPEPVNDFVEKPDSGKSKFMQAWDDDEIFPEDADEKIEIRSRITSFDIENAVARGFEIKKKLNSGQTILYPDGLDEYEQICLDAYTQGYNRAEHEDQLREQRKRK